MKASARKLRISAATLHGNNEASKCEIGPIADLPAARFAQKTSLPMPFGATTPRPVITTWRRWFMLPTSYHHKRAISAPGHGGSGMTLLEPFGGSPSISSILARADHKEEQISATLRD